MRGSSWNTKTVVLGMAIVVLAAMVIILWGTFNKDREEVHFHAGFLVYIDGKLQDYSQDRYMDTQPCSIPGKEMAEDEQIEKAHLHDNVSDVVHVHRAGAVWGDLFQNIKVSFAKLGPVIGYKDDQVIPNILTKKIEEYESVVIVVGDQSGSADFVGKNVSLDHIRQVESKSETCGEEGLE